MFRRPDSTKDGRSGCHVFYPRSETRTHDVTTRNYGVTDRVRDDVRLGGLGFVKGKPHEPLLRLRDRRPLRRRHTRVGGSRSRVRVPYSKHGSARHRWTGRVSGQYKCKYRSEGGRRGLTHHGSLPLRHKSLFVVSVLTTPGTEHLTLRRRHSVHSTSLRLPPIGVSTVDVFTPSFFGTWWGWSASRVLR